MTPASLPLDHFSSTPFKLIPLGSLSVVAEQKYGSKSVPIGDFNKATLLIDVTLKSGGVDTLTLGWEASLDGVFGSEDIYPIRLLDPTSASLSLVESLAAVSATGRYVIPIPFDLVVPYIRLTATGVDSSTNGYTVSASIAVQRLYR